METRDIDARLDAAFGDAGVEGYLHAIDIDTGNEVRYGADKLVHTASVGKVPILVTLAQAIAAGEHDLRERVTVPAENRTSGPTGLSTMEDEVDLSLRDLAQLMIVVSDNAATDVVLGMVTPGRVTTTMRSLGLTRTAIDCTIAEMFARSRAYYDGADTREEREARMHHDPQLHGETMPWRTTPAEVTQLLSMIWRDEAAPADLCRMMRTILQQQVWPHRLSAGFSDEVKIGAKTGTLTGGIRNEAGVLEFPDGHRYAVAVFTRTAVYTFRNPAADRVIGTSARLAVDHLRAVAPVTV
jgi:beta-lactamase class A